MKALAICSVLLFAITALPQTHKASKKGSTAGIDPESCDLSFAGTARKAVKLRTAQDGADYVKVNDGKPITVEDWFAMTCKLDDQVPSKVPASQAMKGIETQKVTLKGFLMGAKLDPDHDIHAEVAGSPKWATPHLIVEVPPGQQYCAARKALWDIVKTELPAHSTSKIHVMKTPAPVTVTGYLFLYTAHGKTDFCHTRGGRGITPAGKKQQVQGLWEIHPVLELQASE